MDSQHYISLQTEKIRLLEEQLVTAQKSVVAIQKESRLKDQLLAELREPLPGPGQLGDKHLEGSVFYPLQEFLLACLKEQGISGVHRDRWYAAKIVAFEEETGLSKAWKKPREEELSNLQQVLYHFFIYGRSGVRRSKPGSSKTPVSGVNLARIFRPISEINHAVLSLPDKPEGEKKESGTE